MGGRLLQGCKAAPLAAPRCRVRRARCSAHSVCAAAPPAGTGAPSTRLFVARRFGVDVDETGLPPGRRLRDYVRLPADKYNVLDSKAVTRVSDTEFRVSTGVQRMLAFEAEPVGFIQIRVLPEGVEQRLTRAELLSSKKNGALDEVNATLKNLALSNTVTAEPAPDGVGRQLVCQLVLDGTFTRGVLSRVPEARLNGLMSWALGVAMPWFLTKLRDDYRMWATDQPRNTALGTGELAKLARSLATGGAAMPPGVRELPVLGAVASGAAVSPMAPTADEAGVPQPAESTRGRGFGKPK